LNRNLLLICTVSSKNLDLALGLLYQAGLTTVEEKKVRGRIILSTKIPKSISPRHLLQEIKNLPSPYPLPTGERAGERAGVRGRVKKIFLDFKIEKIKDPSWATRYLKFLKPFSIGNITIDARGGNLPEKRNKNTLYLDPSLAFGTGTHPTTRMCAELLQKILFKNPPYPPFTKGGGSPVPSFIKGGIGRISLLDLGCGSGILSMISYKLGARKIVAIDNDPIALKISRGNFRKNKIRGMILESSLQKVKKKFDMIIANILLSTLLELKDEILKHLKPNGLLLLSGLTYKDCPEIIKTYKEFHCLKRLNQKGWCALLFQKQSYHTHSTP